MLDDAGSTRSEEVSGQDTQALAKQTMAGPGMPQMRCLGLLLQDHVHPETASFAGPGMRMSCDV